MASIPDTKSDVVDEKALSVLEQDDDPSISNVEEQPLVRRIDLHLLWAVVLGCHAAGENFAVLCSLRVLLGAFEATISPGFTLITGLWYKPSEHARHHSLWFWLFIVLGIVTAGWAVVLYIWLPDTPATARFLNPAQRVWATQRPQVAQRSFKTNKWSNAQLLEAMLDPKTWFQFLVITTVSLSNGVIANFSSLIIRGLNFDSRQSLLLGMPMAAYNVIIVLLSASLVEKFRRSRCIIAASASALSLVGTILVRQLPSTNNAGRYVGLILCASCANVFPMLSLISSNVAGFTKKSTVNAVFFLGYCAGNIAGPQFFIPTEAPQYGTAFTALFVIFCILIGLILAFRQYLAWENSRRDKTQGVYIDAESPERDAMSGAVMEATDETDFENKNFRYYL
ncbi:major facilitator superfamily domain-containing protein [Fusarium phyllophilum]|uniref:Major facilitator superfamily domain-containing protein n=1 Tax=Fusarium phyllophilum TaxID=47803 RepID=A0A8H5K434_9HYPO|nr:major facilitator superfamily domain-containing protein [Fusarium phyllophilum]